MTDNKTLFGNRYEVTSRHAGGSSTVLEALDTVTGRTVAIKTPNENILLDKKSLEKFYEEARRLCHLGNENVVTAHHFYEIGDIDDQCHLVMEWMDKTLDDVIEEQTASPSQIEEIIRQTLCGTRYIHQQGLLHRDLKPSNIFISKNYRSIKIGDLGIAGDIGSGSTVMGTFQYLAPELGNAALEPDERADIYALGLIFYELLCGREKFQEIFSDIYAENSEQVRQIRWMNWHLDTDRPLPDLSHVSENISAKLSAVIKRMTAKNREQRYRDLDEVYSAFAGVFEESSWNEDQIKPINLSDESDDSEKSKKPLVVGGLAVAAVLIIAVIGFIFYDAATVLTDADVMAINELRESARAKAVEAGAEDLLIPEFTKGDSLYDEAIPAYESEDRKTAIALLKESLAQYEQSIASVSTLLKNPIAVAVGSNDSQIDAALQLCETYANNCEKSWYESESSRTADVKPFKIEPKEATVAEFRAFVDATGHQTTAEASGYSYVWNGEKSKKVDNVNWRQPEYAADDNQPVTHLSYEDAASYCAWKDARLPSEAEWEFAARGSSGTIFPWGNDWSPELLSWGGNSDSKPASVGSFPKSNSTYPAYDYAGSVWEWIQSDNADTAYLKGGSYMENNPANIRSAARLNQKKLLSHSDYGVRCARSADKWPLDVLKKQM